MTLFVTIPEFLMNGKATHFKETESENERKLN